MLKALNFLITLLYVLLSTFVCLIIVLLIDTITSKEITIENVTKLNSGFFGDAGIWIMLIGWIALCYASPFLFSRIYIYFNNWRNPIREEQNLAEKCTKDVLEKAGSKKAISLLIEEELTVNASAFSTNYIILSKGMLKTMDENQIKSVIAHELGHLKSRDSYFILVNYYCKLFLSPFKFILKFIGKTLAQNILLGLFVIVVLIVAGNSVGKKGQEITIMAAIFILTIILIAILNKILDYLFLALSRSIEFARDFYAYKLGYGTYMEKSLAHLSEISPQKGSAFFYLTSTHPIIQSRIRKLEQLNSKTQNFKQ
ncbi:MAG: hypothetical protein RIR12_1673 [Bacteroidota bacterium]|jgi:heat shock protein HtpX